jgi:hypothetical protein
MELHHTKARRISLFRALHVIMVSSYEDYKIVPLHTYIFFVFRCYSVRFYLISVTTQRRIHRVRRPVGTGPSKMLLFLSNQQAVNPPR